MVRITLQDVVGLLDSEGTTDDPTAIVINTIGDLVRAGRVPDIRTVLQAGADTIYRRGAGYTTQPEASRKIKEAAQRMIDAGELVAPPRGPCRLIAKG